ncbi:MAG: hypothetical protein KGH54_01675 [Candidatus Micrarchaeota archaeon]|nr:hypothetical protein [Candidatus Micrarchaeota archaeon]
MGGRLNLNLFYRNGVIQAPENWISEHNLQYSLWKSKRDNLHVSTIGFSTLQNALRKNSAELKKHPEWSVKIKGGQNTKPTTYYSPEFIKVIEKTLESSKRVYPYNWMTEPQIKYSCGFGVSKNLLREKIIELERKNDGSIEFKGEYIMNGKKAIFYSPEFVSLVKIEMSRELGKAERLREKGWRTKTDIKKELIEEKIIGASTVTLAIEKNRKELEAHPEWKEEAWNWKKWIFYAPKFVEIIKKSIISSHKRE